MRTEDFLYLFADETETFRSPAEPDAGDVVTLNFRTAKDAAKGVFLVNAVTSASFAMQKTAAERLFDFYTVKINCEKEPIEYYFKIELRDGVVIYDKRGINFLFSADTLKRLIFEGGENADEVLYNLPEFNYFDGEEDYIRKALKSAFYFTPSFHVPEWSKGVVQYQIFPDRFYNGDTSNDVLSNEYYYIVGHSEKVEDWYKGVDYTDIRRFYGGDIKGVLDKLDYIESLGVTTLYFNPIFISPSSHKYDVQDYNHIDPHLGVIKNDGGHFMQWWEHHNGYAPKYIKRVTDRENLEETDKFFAEFCKEVHKRGMKIILDGVFNHCGSFNKWLDREGIYLYKEGFLRGAYKCADSKYRNYFCFKNSGYSGEGEDEYEGWWGHVTLPKLNYEHSEELCEEIFQVAEKWLKPPYLIDGWRLDVAADLGHSPEFNHNFWKRFRKRVKAVRPDALIIAEHYGDPSDYLNGDEWDTVMNYDAFMEPVTYFLTGMEKHSNEFLPHLYLNGKAFFCRIKDTFAAFQRQSLCCAMNELSNHDHSRFLTRTNRTAGKLNTLGEEAAARNVDKAVLRQAVVMQMTFVGAPTVYYADEAGQVGWTDPDCRRTYPWGREDLDLIAFHREIAAFHNGRKRIFTDGSFVPLYADYGTVVYGRVLKNAAVIVAVNPGEGRTAEVRLAKAGDFEGKSAVKVFSTEKHGCSADGHGGYLIKEPTDKVTVNGGRITLDLKGNSADIYLIENE